MRLLRIRYLLAFWLFVLSGVAFLDRTNVSIAGLEITKAYGFGNQGLGWVFSAFLLGYAMFQVPAGWLAARYGPRRVLTLGALCWGATTVATALLPTGMAHAVVLLIVIRLLLGAAEAVVYPAANQFVARWVPPGERGVVNGVIFAGVGAGSGLTPPFLNWLIATHGWRAAFWFSAGLGIVVGLAWWLLARDTPEEHPAVSSLELSEIQGRVHEQPGSARDLQPEFAGKRLDRSRSPRDAIQWGAILERRDLPALMIGYFTFGYVAWIYFSWFFLYLVEVRGFNLKASARYSMLPFLSMTVCCLLGGVLSDRLTKRFGLRIGRCGLASAAMGATAIFLLLGSNVRSPAMAALALAAGAGILYLSQSSFWSVSVDIAGRSSGLFSSLVNMGGQIGGATTASLTPWIAHRFGWSTSFELTAMLAVLGALCWLRVHPEQPIDAGLAGT